MIDLPHIESLRGGATAAILAADLDLKTALAQETARRWFARTLSMRSPRDPALPLRPGRPAAAEPRTAHARRVGELLHVQTEP